MATTLEHPAVVSGGLRTRTSARKLADRASLAAISAAGICPDDVDLLLNAGLYRDRNLGEPALAALIQEDVGSSPEDPHPGAHGTFSFDVANGGCGVLSALQIADGFLRAGTIDRALIVASDADPGHGMAPSFPFAATGAAVVCRWDDGSAGIVGFRWERSTDDTFRAQVGFDGRRNVLSIAADPEFDDKAAVVAAKAAASLLADNDLRTSDVDVVIANPLTPGFLHSLSSHLGCPTELLVTIDGSEGVHTAGPLVALAAADERRMRAGSRVLFVSAGAGIVAGAALVVT